MTNEETIKVFQQLTNEQTAITKPYFGRTIQDNGQTFTLDSVNSSGVLYWRKGKGKKLFTVAGYSVKNLTSLFGPAA
jgi:hypothetical protein